MPNSCAGLCRNLPLHTLITHSALNGCLYLCPVCNLTCVDMHTLMATVPIWPLQIHAHRIASICLLQASELTCTLPACPLQEHALTWSEMPCVLHRHLHSLVHHHACHLQTCALKCPQPLSGLCRHLDSSVHCLSLASRLPCTHWTNCTLWALQILELTNLQAPCLTGAHTHMYLTSSGPCVYMHSCAHCHSHPEYHPLDTGIYTHMPAASSVP